MGNSIIDYNHSNSNISYNSNNTTNNFINNNNNHTNNSKSMLFNNHSTKQRIIMHMDMDCFYCSVDRERYPHWRSSPICVVQNGTLVVSSNYYARCRGYPKMGK